MRLSFDRAKPNQPPYGYVIAIVREHGSKGELVTNFATGADKNYGEATTLKDATIFPNRAIARTVSNTHFATSGKDWITYYHDDYRNKMTRIILMAVFLHRK